MREPPKYTRTCEVPLRFPRVDVIHYSADGSKLFKRCAIRTSSFIMGDGDRWGYLNIPTRFRKLQADRQMLTLVLKMEIGKVDDFAEMPAVACDLLAVYAPGYDGR